MLNASGAKAMPVFNVQTAIYLFGLSMLVNVSMLILPLYTLQIFDRVIVSESRETLWMLFMAVVIVAAIYVSMEWCRRHLLQMMSYQVDDLLMKKSARGSQPDSMFYRFLQRLSDYSHSTCLLTCVDILFVPLIWLLLYFLHPYFLLLSLIINLLMLAVVYTCYRSKSTARESDQYLGKSREMQRVQQRSAVLSAADDKIVTFDFNCNQSIQYATLSLRWLLQILVPTVAALLMINHEISAGIMLAALILSMRSLISFDVLVQSTKLFKQYQQLSDVEKSQFYIRPQSLVDCGDDRSIHLNQLPSKGVEGFKVDFACGKIHLISGPCGCGKTRISQCLAGFSLTSSSEALPLSIRYAGCDLADLADSWRARNVGYIGESPQAINVSLLDFVADFSVSNYAQARDACRKVALPEIWISAGDNCTLADLKPSPGHLSAIYLARLICLNPAYVIIDNLDSVMDHTMLKRYMSLLVEFKNDGKVVIICSHRQSLFRACDQLHLLERGNLVYSGDAEKIYSCGSDTASTDRENTLEA